jgi:transcriptional regulator with XRE-family HTH domain
MGAMKMLNSKAIGEKVKFRRQDIGMSQERLAELVGVSFQQVQRYENGRNKISVERIQQIAIALSIPVAYFFDDAVPAPIISDLDEEYAHSAEEKTLLKYFGKVSSKSARQFVITAARLAAKA